MPLILRRGDITTLAVDAIVNAANPSLLGGGGVDGAIHRAAGPGLLAECRTLGGCPTGQARITAGHDLPCRWVIHTVGPVWQGGQAGEEALLRSCYRASLELAAEKDCRSVAFPIISGGVYGYPFHQAVAVAESEILAWEGLADVTVYLVLHGAVPPLSRQQEALLSALAPPPTYAAGAVSEAEAARPAPAADGKARRTARAPLPRQAVKNGLVLPQAAKMLALDAALPAREESAPADLDAALAQMDESFSVMLLRLIDQRGMTDVECYKKANVSRKLFSKIRSDPDYRPSKPTVLAFAIALELTLPQTERLLRTAGFALSRSSKGDVIVEYFIRRGIYDVYAINDALFDFDQSLLGA